MQKSYEKAADFTTQMVIKQMQIPFKAKIRRVAGTFVVTIPSDYVNNGIFPEGEEPALKASTVSLPSILAKASLIWERLLFSTQTNNIFFLALIERNGAMF